MIVRHKDWEAAMNGALVDAEARAFAWGTWDCVHFVASVVEAMTGADPLAEYRGAYADEREAWAVLAERDGNLRAACKRVFGGMIKPCFARRGDVVMLRGGMAIGICIGANAAFASDNGAGLVLRPMSEIVWAFPVGWEAAA